MIYKLSIKDLHAGHLPIKTYFERDGFFLSFCLFETINYHKNISNNI